MAQIELVTWSMFGQTPLMQNSWQTMAPRSVGVKKKKTRSNTPAFEEAKAKLWVNEDGLYYHPSQATWKAIVLACPNIEIGGKATSGLVPPAIEPAGEEFILYDPDTLNDEKPRPLTEKDWVVDIRMVTNKDPKVGSLLVARPKWPKWGGLLVLEVDREVIPADATDILTQILNEAGRRGIGSGRLHKRGSEWFGIRMGKFRAELRA